MKKFRFSRWANLIRVGTLGLLLILGNPVSALASTNDITSEIRTLLQEQYANPLPQGTLNESSYQKMLSDLNDPYTLYLDKEKYQDFVNMLEMKFSGIGIYANIVPQGVLVTGVIPGSPAEKAGLTKGDVIMDADQNRLAGLMQEDALNYLRGQEGTTANLTVLKGGDVKRVLVERTLISLPDVTGEVRDGHIGYIVVNMFGKNTSTDLKEEVLKLQGSNVDSWIIDLRNNPGGYVNTALDMAGYFIGPSSTVQVKDKAGNTTLYTAEKHSFVLNQPVIFLTNENTASAAEILSAAEQDHQKGLLVGTKTFGKGSMQGVFSLSGGGALKMTIGHFFSPFGHTIDKVGVSPDVAVKEEMAPQAAELLLSASVSSPDAAEGYDKLTVNGQVFDISLSTLRNEEYWASWNALLNTLPSTANLQERKDSWQQASPEDLKLRWPLLYPDYLSLPSLKDLALNNKFVVHFASPISLSSINSQNVELISSNDGKRVPVSFISLNSKDIQVAPKVLLQAGTEYWLVVHSNISDSTGHQLGKGSVTIAHTTGSAAN